MKLYVYDDKKKRTELVLINENEDKLLNNEVFDTENNIRKVWHLDLEEWYFSIFDVVKELTDSKDTKQ